MVENKQDALIRALVTLSSLRVNIDQMTTKDIPETYVGDFHTVLDRLEGIGINVSRFRIPDSRIKPRIISIHTLTFANSPTGVDYSNEKYVDKPLILTKLDAILGYLETITSEKPRKMGFTKYPPESHR